MKITRRNLFAATAAAGLARGQNAAQSQSSSPLPGRSFTKDSLREIAFPLGGIGTGTVSLGGRGDLRDWEIFNRPAKGRWLPYTFFALWARPEGGDAVARVLERRLLPPFVAAQ